MSHPSHERQHHETEIHQVVINLVGNAADAMGNNGVLSVVHGIVTAHDGAMVVTSTPGE